MKKKWPMTNDEVVEQLDHSSLRRLRIPISPCGSNARYRDSYKLKKESSNAERSM